MVITRRVSLWQIIEEAQYARIFIIHGEEVVVLYATVAAKISYPFPSIVRRYVIAEVIGQVDQLRALVPR